MRGRGLRWTSWRPRANASNYMTPQTDDMYDLYDLYDPFPLQFMIEIYQAGQMYSQYCMIWLMLPAGWAVKKRLITATAPPILK